MYRASTRRAVVFSAAGIGVGLAIAVVLWRWRKKREVAIEAVELPVVNGRLYYDGPLTEDDWTAAEKLLLAQESECARLLDTMGGFPSSCLYDSDRTGAAEDEDRCLKGYQEFLRHVVTVFGSSPRNQMLETVKVKLQQDFDASDDVRRLYGILRCPRSATLHDLEDAYKEFSPGAKYRTWDKLRAIAETEFPFTCEKLEKMKEGKRRKAETKGQQPLSPRSEEAWADGVINQFHERIQRVRTEMDEMWPLVEDDSEYQVWQEVQRLWKSVGLARYVADYRGMDVQEGTDRMFRGGAFEGEKARVGAAVVARRLVDAGLLDPNAEWDYYVGAIWKEYTGKGKENFSPVGEVDLVLVSGGVVVAVVEMKTCAFEVSAATVQHTSKIIRAVQDPSDMQLRVCAGGVELPLQFTREHLPPLYVATLIPPHDFLLGAEPLVIRAVSEDLFGKRRSKGGVFSWQFDRLNPNDAERCRASQAAVRKSMREKGKPLVISPCSLLQRATSTKGLVIDGIKIGVLVLCTPDEDVSRFFA